MKKVYLIFWLVLIITSITQSQIFVDEEGNTGVKNLTPLADIHVRDSGNLASIIIERSDHGNYINLLSGTTGNSFFFSKNKRFSIGSTNSITNNSSVSSNALYFYGHNWSETAQRKNVGIGLDNPNEKLHVNGSVKAASFITTSDRRLKSQIESMKYGLNEVLQLNPVIFKYTNESGLNDPDAHFGLIAQELQDVVPDLVESYEHLTYEWNEEGEPTIVNTEEFLQVHDSEIKFILINAIKDQHELCEEKNEVIEDMQVELEEMRNEINSLKSHILENKLHKETIYLGDDGSAYLAQNIPNPFESETIIQYFVPHNVSSAKIIFSNSQGRLLYSYTINDSGHGELQVKMNQFIPGTYIYSLYLDEGIVASRKMIVE